MSEYKNKEEELLYSIWGDFRALILNGCDCTATVYMRMPEQQLRSACQVFHHQMLKLKKAIMGWPETWHINEILKED